MSFKTDLEAAIEIREQGNPTKAAALLSQLGNNAKARKRYDNEADALVHWIICYQLIYEDSKDFLYISLMRAYAQRGLSMCQRYPSARSRQRQFLYRYGVASYLAKQYRSAVEYFNQAIDGLEENELQYPEFAGYCGAAYALCGEQNGFKFLDSASKAFERNKRKYTLKHRRVILSGLHMRKAQAYHKFGQYDSAFQELEKAGKIAVILNSRYGYVYRLRQYENLSRDIGRHPKVGR
jgi:tetratricopeptide (TPR) repeat protein